MLPVLSTKSPLLLAQGPDSVCSGGCGREAGLGSDPICIFPLAKIQDKPLQSQPIQSTAELKKPCLTF